MQRSSVTLADVAAEAQVSRMSVSRALNGQAGVSEETRQRILDIANQLGYTQAARNGDTPPAIGLLVPAIDTSYMGEILSGVCSAAERLHYGLLLSAQATSTATWQTSQTTLNNNLVAGVLMVVPHDYETIVSDLKARELPYVIIDHHMNNDNEPSVTATNRRGILDAMRHLLALGHRRIGFITGRMDIASSHDRLQGYRDGLAEVGLPFEAELVCEGDFTQSVGFHHTQTLLALEERPTAIVASNDVMAFGAMDAIKAAGLTIGHDVSIVGFDDIHMASQVYPPLTTVRQPMAEMGEVAMEMLVNLIEERVTLSYRRELPTDLIIRSSTGRAPSV